MQCTPSCEAPTIEFVRNLSGGVTGRLQFPDAGKNALLCPIGFQVQAVRIHAVSKWNGTHALTVRPLVAHGVSRPFADRLALPLRNRNHDVKDQSAGRAPRVESIRHAHEGHAAALEALQ